MINALALLDQAADREFSSFGSHLGPTLEVLKRLLMKLRFLYSRIKENMISGRVYIQLK